MKKLILLIAINIVVINAFSQKFEWASHYFGITDNREYFNSYQYDQTIIASRLGGEIGFLVDSIHRFRTGLSYIYEYGSPKNFDKNTNLIMYYSVEKQPFTLYVGAFPRVNLLNYPVALLTDTLDYYRPTIEGLYLKYQHQGNYQNIWIDWTSRQQDSIRETFMAGTSGRWGTQRLFFSNYIMMYHHALPLYQRHDEHIRDNSGASLGLNVDLSHLCWIDSCTLSVNELMSMDRNRAEGLGFQQRFGNYLTCHLSHQGYGLDMLFYRGQGQILYWGDTFYKATRYNRFDFYFTPLRFKHIKGKFIAGFHYIEGKINVSQRFNVSIDLDSRK